MRLHHLTWGELVVPVLLAAAGTAEIAASDVASWPTGIASLLVAAGVLTFARRAPLAVPPVSASIYALTPLAGFDVSPYATWNVLLAAACFGAGLYAARPQVAAGLVSVLVTLAVAYAGLRWLTPFEPSLLFGLILSLGPFGLGVALRTALDRERASAVQAERAQAEASFAVERAVRAERERLAVELHDALAHAVGQMLVQATAAADQVRSDAESAARMLADVAATGREGLAETGRLLHVLRDENNELGLRNPDREAKPVAAAAGRRHRFTYALVPALAGVLATVEIVAHDFRPRLGMLACYWLAAAALLARRRLPVALPLAVSGILLAGRLLGLPVSDPASTILVVALACFAAGRHVPRRWLWAGLASTLAAAGLPLADAAAHGELSGDVVLILAGTVGPWVAGVLLRVTLERTRMHAAAVERARLERAQDTERAMAGERRRIGRELHDVLAASLSVMSVQATLAAELVTGDTDAGAAAVTHVERAGRAALGEVGRLLRLARSDAVGTEPNHRLADLPMLIADYTRAGLRVDLDTGAVAHLPIGIGSSVYRVVQEALTNALKHAPGSTVRVTVSCAGPSVDVEVVNDPPPGPPARAVPSGHGLLGLRERVTLLGGRFQAGGTAAGGFLLAASIPLAEDAA